MQEQRSGAMAALRRDRRLTAVLAAVLGLAALLPLGAWAQAPLGIGSEFYGRAATASGIVLYNGTIQAWADGSLCGQAPLNGDGTYAVTVQAVPGCVTPGQPITFVLCETGAAALQSGTLPSVPGTPVHLDLVFGPGNGTFSFC